MPGPRGAGILPAACNSQDTRKVLKKSVPRYAVTHLIALDLSGGGSYRLRR